MDTKNNHKVQFCEYPKCLQKDKGDKLQDKEINY